MKMEKFVVVVIFFVLSVPGWALEDVPIYECYRVSEPPTIDGNLDDKSWKAITPITPFLLATTATEATSETKASLCWDDTNLYVSFYCADNAIWGTLSKNDTPIFNEEVVEVFLKPDLSKETYLEFEVSPRNVLFDAAIRVATDDAFFIEGRKWNCEGFRTAVVVEGDPVVKSENDKWWQVEMAIPFKSLGRQTPKQGEIWRANLYRIEHGDYDEFQAWSPTLTNPPSYHVPKRFGKLLFKTHDRKKLSPRGN